ncbi:LysR substrate-binding domain-containing protein [Lacibacterium aquatile]|uniref:LysR substrate-binding domain-containing protein n=1 Tax=Lacibacterium aquatile TaxID=1168082 RepID=A0ABW5DNQ6_9PROT
MISFDPDHLQTLVAFAETGSLSQAARVIGRTASAVTTQMQLLEQRAGTPLLAVAGRKRVLTPAGETLLRHARLILAAHSEAMADLAGRTIAEPIRLGLTEDFAENELHRILAIFAADHPQSRLDLRVGRSTEILTAMRDGQLDVVLASRNFDGGREIATLTEPLRWFVGADFRLPRGEDVPLALLDAPCTSRSSALKVLETSGHRFRIAASSPSLAGVRASVRANLAVTARVARWSGPDIRFAGPELDLPPLPPASYSIRLRDPDLKPARQLADVMINCLAAEPLLQGSVA